MGEIDRDEVFGKESGKGYLWCLHCERTYRNGEYREEAEEIVNSNGETEKFWFQMCPYEGCAGDTVWDGWEWERIREGHPEYPEVPEKGRVYPMS